MSTPINNFKADTNALKKGQVVIYSYTPYSAEYYGVYLGYIEHPVMLCKDIIDNRPIYELTFSGMYCFSGHRNLEPNCSIDDDESFKWLKVFNKAESDKILDIYYSGENDEYKMDIVLEYLAEIVPEYCV